MLDLTNRLTDALPVMSAKSAARTITGDSIVVVSGFGSVGYPKKVPLALADTGRDFSLTIVSGGSVGEEIDKRLADADAIARRYPYQARGATRTRINDGEMAFADAHISSFGDRIRAKEFGDPDVALIEAIAVGPDWLIPTASIGHTPSCVAAADELIVEVNEDQPLELQEFHDIYLPSLPPNREAIPLENPLDRIGTPFVEFDSEKLSGVVRTDRSDTTYEFRDSSPSDEAIADLLVRFLEEEIDRNPFFEDRLCLQFGVGSLGNALMGGFGDIEIGDRELVYYGEVIQDGLLDMMDAGKLSGASAASLALSEDGLDRLFEDSDRYADDIVIRNGDISNNPALINRFGVIGVNSALEVDIYGNVNSTHVGGTHIQNGIGGSGDFNRNAAVSVVALSSIASSGDISRIVPMVPHVDHTEHDIDIVITEQGLADLRGLVPDERAEALIENCAHPSFREELRSYVARGNQGGGHIPHNLESAYWHLDW